MPRPGLPLIAEGKSLKEAIASVEEELGAIDKAFNEQARTIPNYAHPDAPVGKEDKDNTAIKFVGDIPRFTFKAKDHVQLGESLDLIDFDTATRVSGPKFYYLKREAVILQMALERYAMDIVIKHGFTPFITPDIAKEEILSGIGFNPRGEESNIYTIEGTGACLVGTAEITLGGYYADQIIEREQLPIKMAGLSHCFRREAGGAGQYSRVCTCTPVLSWRCSSTACPSNRMHTISSCWRLRRRFSAVWVSPTVSSIPAPGTWGSAYRKFDIEAWMPGRERSSGVWRGDSTSNCCRLSRRSCPFDTAMKTGKTNLSICSNGTAIALSRAMVAILENYKTEDGSVLIPQSLVPYTGFTKIEARA